jgi:hypothetical protein
LTKKQNDKTTSTISWTNYRGKEITREINLVRDIRDFRGTPGYSMLVVAFNTQLSVSDIKLFLDIEARDFPLVKRSRSWIQRRRWLFQPPGTANYKNPPSDPDGKHAKACAIMAANPTLSIRGLSRLLKEHGIKRSPEWCRHHRGNAVLPTQPVI